MSLPDVLLSLLREPMSGTDLVQLFRGTIGHFWRADLSQIYRTLDTLERDGSLHSRPVPSPRGPARKVYGLTERGRARLVEWVRRPAVIPTAKFEYLAQLFSVTADEQPRERARALLQSMRDDAARDVAVLQLIDAHAQDAPGYPDAMPGHVFYPWLTLRHGLIRRKALLEWIDESLARLARRPESADAELPEEELRELVEVLRLAALDSGATSESTTNEEEHGGHDA